MIMRFKNLILNIITYFFEFFPYNINVKNLIHVSQDLPTFRVGTPVLNEGPFGLNVKDGGLNIKIPFVQARIPYPKIKKGE